MLRRSRSFPVGIFVMWIFAGSLSGPLLAQMPEAVDTRSEEIRTLRKQLTAISARLEKLEAEESPPPESSSSGGDPAAALSSASAALKAPSVPAPPLSTADRKTLDGLAGTTFNVLVDTYYGYNFNQPIGRVNLLRAYDVSSNAVSLNQADFVVEHAADAAAGKRFGVRLDLQFGQATATLQGNPNNEPRPQIYRNIFQAYGTYIVPIGSGLTIDFGKWASSLGFEGNYTKDQINYSRSYWFDFLPFYHAGLRATYQVNPWLAGHYWVVNGTQQTEPTNGYKDEMFGVELTPHKIVDWTINYYLGDEHPDFLYVTSGPASLPTQQGYPFVPVVNPPKGKLHIIDSYATWNATHKLTLVGEGDYVIQRDQVQSAPSHTDGGALYAKYQLTPVFDVAGRAEYLSDRGGLYSGKTQALKEFTFDFDQTIGDGFQMREEVRRDFSNQPFFLTDTLGVLSKDQVTATLGLIWWFGGKQGVW